MAETRTITAQIAPTAQLLAMRPRARLPQAALLSLGHSGPKRHSRPLMGSSAQTLTGPGACALPTTPPAERAASGAGHSSFHRPFATMAAARANRVLRTA